MGVSGSLLGMGKKKRSKSQKRNAEWGKALYEQRQEALRSKKPRTVDPAPVKRYFLGE